MVKAVKVVKVEHRIIHTDLPIGSYFSYGYGAKKLFAKVIQVGVHTEQMAIYEEEIVEGTTIHGCMWKKGNKLQRLNSYTYTRKPQPHWSEAIPPVALSLMKTGNVCLIDGKFMWIIDAPRIDGNIGVIDIKAIKLLYFPSETLVQPTGDQIGFKQR